MEAIIAVLLKDGEEPALKENSLFTILVKRELIILIWKNSLMYFTHQLFNQRGSNQDNDTCR